MGHSVFLEPARGPSLGLSLGLRSAMGALAMACALVLPGAAMAQSGADGAQAVFPFNERFHPVVASQGMVSSQDRLATEVGAEILSKGGNAVDAAVAVGFALAVTHPSAGNLGGGGFMLIQGADGGRAIAIDYREAAPSGASADMFLNDEGAVDSDRARFSLLSSGVPGTVKGLIHALERYGSMDLKTVLAPAIALAEDGFVMSYPLAESLARRRSRFERDPSSAAYFSHPDGRAYQAGDRFRQKDLARTLKLIARRGANAFYEGQIADQIVAEMERGGGLVTRADLAAYEVKERAPVTGTFRDYQIVSMPPPSSGGVHVVQMLNILEGWDLKGMGHNSVDYLHRLIESMRRAFADRSKYLGDPDFFDVPVAALTDKAYGARLRESIDLERASLSSEIAPAKSLPFESSETTHYSVMDADGMTVANTYTLNFSYGNGYSVDGAGFLLNNEMDDFSAKPGTPNAFGLIGAEANKIEPGKRPLSSMTPVIVLKDGVPILSTGSPGGSTIITVVLQLLLNHLEFQMNIASATAAPRIHHQWLPDLIFLESGITADTARALEARGFKLRRDGSGALARRALGRLNTVARRGPLFLGAADPRGPKSASVGVDPWP